MAASTGRTEDCTRPTRQNVEFSLAMREPSTEVVRCVDAHFSAQHRRAARSARADPPLNIYFIGQVLAERNIAERSIKVDEIARTKNSGICQYFHAYHNINKETVKRTS